MHDWTNYYRTAVLSMPVAMVQKSVISLGIAISWLLVCILWQEETHYFVVG